MRASRHDPIAVPLGAIERPRNPCRELSALTDGDLATPAVWRRPTAPRWEDLSPELRAAAREGAKAKLREMHGAGAAAAIDVIDRCWR